MKKTVANEDRTLLALEKIKALLEDLFILQASLAGMKKEPLRAVLSIDKNRIGRIAKHVEAQKAKREPNPKR